MSFGMIARADSGGLANQTWEIARHLRPDRILIVDVREAGRGEFRADRYAGFAPEIRQARNIPRRGVPLDMLEWLLDTDRVFTVEGPYNEAFIGSCVGHGKPLVLYANPELYPARYQEHADEGVIRVLAPTGWETGRLGRHKVLPMPVARDRVKHQHREGPARTFLHVSAPAMLDRNGTNLLRDAIGEYNQRGEPAIRLLVTGPEAPPETIRQGRVTIIPVGPVADYWELYTEADMLILPRRYGGLSLVMQEALASGMPVIALDRYPERSWGGVETVRVSDHRWEPMKGGQVRLDTCTPAALATRIRFAATTDTGLSSTRADQHAAAISWDRLFPAWQQTLR